MLLALAACSDPAGPPPPVALVVTASDTIQVTGRTLTFSAMAVDSTGAAVPAVPIAWTVSDARRGSVTADGVFTAQDSGRVFIRATLVEPSLAESVAVQVVAPGTVKWRWAGAGIGDPGAQFPTVGGPALAPDGSVYVLARRSTANYQAVLVALSTEGEPRWMTDLDSVGANYPIVTPGDDIVVVGKRIYVVNAAGSIRWQTGTDAPTPTFKAGAVTDEMVVAAVGMQVLALRLASGDTVWQSPEAPLGSWLVPPTIVRQDVVYAKHTADTLFVFRHSDGAILKTFLDPDTALDKSVFGAGTVPVDDRLYLPTTNRLAAFDTTGPLLWLTDETGRGMSEPAVGPDGVLYVQNRRWGLQAINPDGTTRWYRKRFIPPVGPSSEEPRWTWYGGAALAEGGVLYAAGYDRFLAYDVEGALQWEHLADSAGVPQAFIGSPSIGPDGTVYTYTATHVYAFWGAGRPEPNSPWPMWRHDAQRTGWAR
jgi:hypothetical protein